MLHDASWPKFEENLWRFCKNAYSSKYIRFRLIFTNQPLPTQEILEGLLSSVPVSKIDFLLSQKEIMKTEKVFLACDGFKIFFWCKKPASVTILRGNVWAFVVKRLSLIQHIK